MPSKEQFQELIDKNYTTTEWTTQEGVYGRKITSKKNGNSIFLPAAGYSGTSGVSSEGSRGTYWSRTLGTSSNCATELYFGSSTISYQSSYRYTGANVRPVRGEHEYVEIGGIKWATMNLGATTVAGSYNTCFGDYFASGETEPRYETITFSSAIDATFVWKSKYSGGYHDDPKSYQDAATAAWGGSWRMPKKEDFEELARACDPYYGINGEKIEYATYYHNEITHGGVYFLVATQHDMPEYTGVDGFLFVDRSDITKRVFFPACGYIYNTMFNNYAGREAYYWCSPKKNYTEGDLYIMSLDYSLGGMLKKLNNYTTYGNYGCAIRPVRD